MNDIKIASMFRWLNTNLSHSTKELNPPVITGSATEIQQLSAKEHVISECRIVSWSVLQPGYILFTGTCLPRRRSFVGRQLLAARHKKKFNFRGNLQIPHFLPKTWIVINLIVSNRALKQHISIFHSVNSQLLTSPIPVIDICFS